jgi:hypothetical protein
MGGGSARACHAADGERGGHGVGSRAEGPEWLRAARFKLGFKPIQNIQTVQMKFEFLQTLAGSKDTFLRSKNLK